MPQILLRKCPAAQRTLEEGIEKAAPPTMIISTSNEPEVLLQISPEAQRQRLNLKVLEMLSLNLTTNPSIHHSSVFVSGFSKGPNSEQDQCQLPNLYMKLMCEQ